MDSMKFLGDFAYADFLPYDEWNLGLGQIDARPPISTISSLAQVSQAIASHSCNAAHVRNRDAQTDFYARVNSDTPFDDTTFPQNDAIYW